MKILSRNDAKTQGLKRYNSDSPCPRGHVAERYVKSNICVECGKASVKRNRAQNPERTKELYANHRRKAFEKDPERFRERDRRRAKDPKRRQSLIRSKRKHRSKHVAYNKDWRHRNTEKARSYTRRWQVRNPAIRRAAVRKRQAAIANRLPVWADLRAIKAVYKEAERRTKETGVAHHVDHYYPLRGKLVSGLHVPANLQILTAEENIRKGNQMPSQERAA